MADQVPAGPGNVIPVSAKLAPSQASGGTHPPTPARSLDNPPRTRVISSGPPASPASSASFQTQDTFAGLSLVDVFNIQEAMRSRLDILSGTENADPEQLASARRILEITARKLNPAVNQVSIRGPVPPPFPARPTFFPGEGGGGST